MDSKGQDILFNSEMNQKDLMIQMLSERLDEKDETITELKETINDLKDTIAGLRETLDEFQRKLFGTGSEKTKQDKKTEETVTTIVKSHKRTTRKAKATREDQYGNLPIHKEVIPLLEEDKYCPYCNSKMEYVTETFVRKNSGSHLRRWNEFIITRKNGSARNAKKMVMEHPQNPKHLPL